MERLKDILYPGGWETNYGLYLTGLKIGTTRGASDIWTTTLADLSEADRKTLEKAP